MEGYCASFWTSHGFSTQHVIEIFFKALKSRGPLDELHFKDVQSTPIMVEEVEKKSLLPPKRKTPQLFKCH